jgi:DMSO/TMAO reductase YedYZ heme-binding membrane subunit
MRNPTDEGGLREKSDRIRVRGTVWVMPEDLLILLARILAIAGVMLLAASAVLGVFLASRTAQQLRLLRGRTFRIHRLLSVLAAGLLLAHPVPVVLARETTGAGLAAGFVPFAAEKLVLNLAFGAVALDILLIVLASSLLIKRLPRKVWRRLHYGAYAVLALGLYHGLLIPNDFGPAARYATVAPLAFDKVLVELAIIGVLLASAWRVAAGVRRRAAPQAMSQRHELGAIARIIIDSADGGRSRNGQKRNPTEGGAIMANDDTDAQAHQPPEPSLDLKCLDRLVGTWEVSGGVQGRVVQGRVTFEWMEGDFFLIQHVDLEQYGQRIKGIEIIGHERLFGAEPSEEIKSRFYDNMGNTLDYVYELEGDTLTIWGGEKGSPAYSKGTFSDDGDTLSSEWVYPGGGGYRSTMTRAR